MLIFCLFHLYYVYAHRLQLSWWLYLATLEGWWWEARHWGVKDPHAIHTTKERDRDRGWRSRQTPDPFQAFLPGLRRLGSGTASRCHYCGQKNVVGNVRHLSYLSLVPFTGSSLVIQSLPSSLHRFPSLQHVHHLGGKGNWEWDQGNRTATSGCWLVAAEMGGLSHLSLTIRGVAHGAHSPGRRWKLQGPRALVTKSDPEPFMCFTKVTKLRQDYNCSSHCQGWKVGSLKYAPAVLMKSLKSNIREKGARKVTCITLIKEEHHGEVVNLNHCLNFNLFINRICPSLRMLLLPFAAQQQLWV